jgi:hypothetical protein
VCDGRILRYCWSCIGVVEIAQVKFCDDNSGYENVPRFVLSLHLKMGALRELRGSTHLIA